MDAILLRVSRAGSSTGSEPMSIDEPALKKQANPFGMAPLRKALEAFDREAESTQRARQQMQSTFADALDELDDAFESNLQQLSEAHAQASPLNADLPPPTLLVDHREAMNQFEVAIDRLCKRFSRSLYIPPVHVSFNDPYYDQKSYQGDEVLRKFRQVYESFPEPPTSMQKRFLEASMASMAALIYGDEYSNDPEYVFRCSDVFGNTCSISFTLHSLFTKLAGGIPSAPLGRLLNSGDLLKVPVLNSLLFTYTHSHSHSHSHSRLLDIVSHLAHLTHPFSMHHSQFTKPLAGMCSSTITGPRPMVSWRCSRVVKRASRRRVPCWLSPC